MWLESNSTPLSERSDITPIRPDNKEGNNQQETISFGYTKPNEEGYSFNFENKSDNKEQTTEKADTNDTITIWNITIWNASELTADELNFIQKLSNERTKEFQEIKDLTVEELQKLKDIINLEISERMKRQVRNEQSMKNINSKAQEKIDEVIKLKNEETVQKERKEESDKKRQEEMLNWLEENLWVEYGISPEKNKKMNEIDNVLINEKTNLKKILRGFKKYTGWNYWEKIKELVKQWMGKVIDDIKDTSNIDQIKKAINNSNFKYILESVIPMKIAHDNNKELNLSKKQINWIENYFKIDLENGIIDQWWRDWKTTFNLREIDTPTKWIIKAKIGDMSFIEV